MNRLPQNPPKDHHQFQDEQYINYRQLYQYLFVIYHASSFPNRGNSNLQRDRDWSSLNCQQKLAYNFVLRTWKEVTQEKFASGYVMNMAFADVMLGAVSLPLNICFWVGFRQPLWRKGVLEPLEVFFLWIDLIFLQASLISAVFISCERFYAVYWPLKHLTVSTRAYAIVITLIWTLAFLVSAFFKLVRDLLPTKTSVYRMTILLVLCCCNIGIWRKFQQRKNAPRNAIHQQNTLIPR